MSYRVRIESFEGPFDLLLSLVSEQKIDIGAISITEVADQYLSYMESMRELDMDVASDFLVVAATLLALKAASLLPDETVVLGEELDDLTPAQARDILIARLIAYKQYKSIAASLNARLESEGRMFARQAGLESAYVGLLPDYLEGVTLHNLAVICADLAARREVFLLEAEHIASKPIPVETRISELISRLEKKKKLTFRKLLEDNSDPTFIVVNFLALLELYHRGMIELEQEQYDSDIKIQYLDPSKWAPAADLAPEVDANANTTSANSVLDEFIQSLELDGGAHA
ncbi:MAG: segregation/condensation protein A [Coriobacteriia bacterium]|nr:segregation/condensation protein A [Coriobacteriia bacterium]